MIATPALLGILAALLLIPSLYNGAKQDLKEYRFSQYHFETLWVNLAGLLTIVMYIVYFIEGNWVMAVELIALSFIAWLVFGFLGFRCGGGGDWRALIYIAWIAPFILLTTLVLSGICGIIHAIYRLSDPDRKINPLALKVPFAVSIFCGYIAALIWMVVSLIPYA